MRIFLLCAAASRWPLLASVGGIASSGRFRMRESSVLEKEASISMSPLLFRRSSHGRAGPGPFFDLTGRRGRVRRPGFQSNSLEVVGGIRQHL
jgi:hypothetical protein